MEQSFRKKLYDATKPQHQAVEGVFDFSNGVDKKNLDLFLKTMLIARSVFQPILTNFENNFGVDTNNSKLMNLLREDIDTEDFNVDLKIQQLQASEFSSIDVSEQIGVFYVLAGSSAGAKAILSLARTQGIKHPMLYFEELANLSKSQMALLKEILARTKFIDDRVIKSAQQTFDLIHQIALNGLRKRTTAI